MMATLAILAAIFLCSPVTCDMEPQQDWWEETVIYQIYPRSFMDSNGDGIGDLNGITSKLQHLKDLGIGATWLSPIFKSPMHDFGYDIENFYEIQPEYGTMEDFEKLIAKAKELDIKILLDFVPNHTSNESMWFKEALKGNKKYMDYFIWADGVVDENGELEPPNNWVSVFRKSAWEYREEVGKFYLHQFVIGQPDLNYRNPEVVEEMKNILRFWLSKGVSGFRVDAVNHLFEVDKDDEGKYPNEPLSGEPGAGADDYGYLNHIYTKNLNETYDMVYQWRKVLDEFKEQDGFARLMMTEAYAPIKDTVKYYGNDETPGAQIPFNFALITDANKDSTAPDIKYTVDKWITYKPLDKHANRFCKSFIYRIGNHDQSRVASRYGPELVDGMNMLVLLLPGIAITYMGEEIGMRDGEVSWEETVDPSGLNTEDPVNYWKASRDPERTPFQWSADKNAGFSTADKTWLPVASNFASLNVESQKTASKSHFKIYQTLVTLRRQPAFRSGRYESLALNEDVFAFRRWYKDEIFVVVINLSTKEQTVDLTHFENVIDELRVVVSSIQSSRNSGEALTAAGVRLAGKEALVLKLSA